jgi:hypothetical protein
MEGKSRNAVCSRGGLGPALVLTDLAASALPQQLRQLRDIRRNPPCLISDTSQEEKYEHTNRNRRNKTIPVWAPRLWSGLGGDDGPSAFLRRTFVQTERLYSEPLHSQAT